LEDYKQLLKISVKPERNVARYIACISVACILCVGLAVFNGWYAIIFIVPWFYLTKYYWQKHYLLSHAQSVIEVRLDQSDELFFIFKDGTESLVELINKLQFSQFTVLYALPQKRRVSLDRMVEESVSTKVKKYIKRFFYKNLIGKRELVFLNENSMATAMYRELNRRAKKSG